MGATRGTREAFGNWREVRKIQKKIWNSWLCKPSNSVYIYRNPNKRSNYDGSRYRRVHKWKKTKSCPDNTTPRLRLSQTNYPYSIESQFELNILLLRQNLRPGTSIIHTQTSVGLFSQSSITTAAIYQSLFIMNRWVRRRINHWWESLSPSITVAEAEFTHDQWSVITIDLHWPWPGKKSTDKPQHRRKHSLCFIPNWPQLHTPDPQQHVPACDVTWFFIFFF